MDDVRSVLSKAVDWRFIEVNPLAGVKKLKVDNKGSVRFLTDDERSRLMIALDQREQRLRTSRDRANAWRVKRQYPPLPSLGAQPYADHLKPMILVSLHTGMRQGELFELRWDDVDLKRSNIEVRGENAKNLQTRHIQMNSVCLKVLTDWRSQSGKATGLVFPGKDGERFDNVKFAWKAVLAKAGIEKFRWHDLRHTFASWLVMKGVDLNTVRELMGHADYQMTLRYSHLAPEHKANAVARLVDSP